MSEMEVSQVFNILSKLLEEEKNEGIDTSQTETEKIFNELYYNLDSKLLPIIEKIHYKDKYFIVDKIRDDFRNISFYMSFPEIIGKNVIGIYGPSSAGLKVIYNKFLKNIYKDIKNDKLVEMIKASLPKGKDKFEISSHVATIILQDGAPGRIKALNLPENLINLEKEEYIYAVKTVNDSKLSLGAVVQALSMTTTWEMNNAAMLTIPAKADKQAKYYGVICDTVDILVIDVIEALKNKKIRDDLKNYKNIKEMVFIGDLNENDIISIKHNMGVKDAVKASSFRNYEDFCNIIFSKYNYARNNFKYDMVFLKYFNEIKAFLSSIMKELFNRIETINKELINNDESTKKEIKNFQKEVSLKIENYQNLVNQYDSICSELIDMIKKLQDNIYKSSDVIKEMHIDMGNVFLELFLQEIQIAKGSNTKGHINNIRDFANEFNRYTDNQYAFITKVLISDYLKESHETRALEQFKNYDTENQLLIREKIRLREILGLHEHYCGMVLSRAKFELNANEHYILGEYYLKNDRQNEALEELYLALKHGDLRAGERILETKEYISIPELENLADYLVPEANYRLGDKYYNNLRPRSDISNQKAIRYLKMAAAFSNVKAVRKLADISYNYAMQYLGNNKEQFNNDSRDAVYYYKIAIDLKSTDKQMYEKLGILYYELGNYRDAKKMFEQSGSSESNFRIGMMYSNALGMAQDDGKALKAFEKAIGSGHMQAQVEYDKINAKILAEKEKNKVQEGASYSSSSSYSGYYTSYSSGW